MKILAVLIMISSICVFFNDAQLEKIRKSNSVGVDGTSYQLVWSEDKRSGLMSLISRSDGKAKEAPLDPITQLVSVSQIQIAQWNKKSVAAVVKGSNAEGEIIFLCLTFLTNEEGAIGGEMVGISQIHSGDDFDILAVNGSTNGDQLIVLLGKRKIVQGSTAIDQGLIYINDCPNPVAIGGSISSFRSKIEVKGLEQLK